MDYHKVNWTGKDFFFDRKRFETMHGTQFVLPVTGAIAMIMARLLNQCAHTCFQLSLTLIPAVSLGSCLKQAEGLMLSP